MRTKHGTLLAPEFEQRTLYISHGEQARLDGLVGVLGGGIDVDAQICCRRFWLTGAPRRKAPMPSFATVASSFES